MLINQQIIFTLIRQALGSNKFGPRWTANDQKCSWAGTRKGSSIVNFSFHERDTSLGLHCRCGHPTVTLFFLLIPLSHQNLHRRLLPETSRSPW